MTISRFQNIILNWYKYNRRDLPWRRTQDPYKILVSEIMLQQTQVSRVLQKYREFIGEFPTLASLAITPDARLLKIWTGLGYWRRAKYLKEVAKRVMKEKTQFERFFPRDPKILEKLPGIGPYTARAVACFAFGSSEAFLDTNIRRVYLHFFFKNKKNISDKEILPIAQKVLSSISSHGNRLRYPKITPREWHYALFDYGAVVLKDKQINKRSKHYIKQSKFEGSFRSFRTKVVQFLLSQPKYRATYQKIKTLLAQAPYPQEEILSALLKDNLIKKSEAHYYV